ncbi:hypothetical protein ACSVC9_01440 [Clostridium sp. LBM24168]
MGKIKSRTGKIVLLIIILIILTVVTFVSLIFWDSSYRVKEYKFSQTALEKIIEAKINGETVKLDSEELNGIVSAFYQNSKTSGNIMIKGINLDIADSTLKFYVPVTYKKFNFLMTSEGRIYLENDRIIYDPLYFRIGKISIPKKYVFNKLSGKLNDKLKVEGNIISISSNVIPINMNSIEVQNKMLLIKVTKSSMNLEKNIMNSAESGVQGNNQTDKNNDSESKVSDNEQAVVSKILSAINSKNKAVLISAETDYNKLSPEGKKRVKAVVKSSLDKNTLEQIQEKIK